MTATPSLGGADRGHWGRDRWGRGRWERGGWWSRTAVAAGYVVGLSAGTALLWSRDEVTRRAWLDWVSTSAANLGDHPLSGHPLGCLVASAFVVEDGPLAAWAVLAAVGLIGLAWRLGPWRTLGVVATAHVVGTLVSEGIVAWRVHQGFLPPASRHLMDVGPSYVVVAALLGAVAAGPLLARVAGALGFAVLAPSLFGGLTRLDVSAVGHVCCVVLGLGLGLALRPQATPAPGSGTMG